MQNDSAVETVEKTVTLKVDRELADAFKRTAKANNRTQSLLIRDFMQDYVKKNGQGKLF